MPEDLLDVAIKVGSAWLVGSLIGLERTIHGRPAGFRTHALVCLSSALLMLVTSYQWRWLGSAPLETIRTDPTRMAQGIMTGIGFLGAGVIFKEGLSVRGLTTAASIWTTAALGILCGVGLFVPAAFGTAVTLGILAAFRWFEDLLPHEFYANHVLRFSRGDTPSETAVRQLLHDHGFKVAKMSYQSSDDGEEFEYRTVIKTRKRDGAERLAEHLRKADHVRGFSISPTGD